MSDDRRENRAAAAVSVLGACFLVLFLGAILGFAIAHRQAWPYQQLVDGWRTVKVAIREGEDYSLLRFRKAPAAGASRELFTVRDPSAIAGGYYAFLGFEAEIGGYTVRLFDAEGGLINRVDVTPAALGLDDNGFPDPHGFQMLRDGSAILAFDRAELLVRVNRCGETVWAREEAFHHSVELTPRDSFWTWRGVPSAYGVYQYMEEIAVENGETLRSIPLEDVLRAEGELAAFFNIHPERPFPVPPPSPKSDGIGDLFHPNDVEELTAALAPAFPMFEIGDLVVSLKTTDMIAVIDPELRRVKWFQRGPWTKQHDPDFMPDGRIAVFDNNFGAGPSQIVLIDPATGAVETHLAGPRVGDGRFSFATGTQGKHSVLSNGNFLVVSPHQGLAAEVTLEGDVLMEFNNIFRAGGRFNGHLPNARQMPDDYFTEAPFCEGAAPG